MTIIGVIGPCAAGKSTLIEGLKRHGISAKHIAQEHSYVADMWRRLTKPDTLIYLDVSYPKTIERRMMNWSVEEYKEQIRRLEHARQHADFYLITDNLTTSQVLNTVLDFLKSR
jgi:deoxyadenosine/deoxycytidine kinase